MDTTTTIAELKNQATSARQDATLDEKYVSISERRLARIARICEEEEARGKTSEELSVELAKATEHFSAAKQKAEQSKAKAVRAHNGYVNASASM